MSNSRLEKFIYAICGMEVDDLPTPLSRIEMLWNCLITGETPDFEPLSRNEKYLMSMLTGDVDGLPEPASRSEKLLYKIATGETDLSDVPGYLSRYEELLKYLAENGGIGGTDFEYVLYTLNQPLSTLYTTAEGPVKSAILKGNTKIDTIIDLSEGYTFSNGIKDFNFISKPQLNKEYILKIQLSDVFITTTKYIAIRGVKTDGTVVELIRVTEDYTDGSYEIPVIFKEEYAKFRIGVAFKALVKGWMKGEILSTKLPVLTTTGKNLFHGIMTSGQLLSNNVIQNNQTKMGYSEFLPVNEELDIYCSFYTNSIYIIEKIYFYDENKNQISMNTRPGKVTTPKGTKYFRISITTADWNSAVVFDDIKDDFNIQVETGIQATPYEPYKSNILSCNEEVTLRGIGEVKDTLDGNTGELTQRIGEVVLDGSVTPLSINTSKNNTIEVNFGRQTDMKIASRLMCDKLPNAEPYNTDIEGICCHVINGNFHFNILKSKIENHTKQGVVDYLSQNPITVQYELETPIVKTVVLSTLDQDGQPTKLSTFNDITHVSIEAEDLLPTVDLEVATKIEETLSSLPTLMNDISETQQSLNEKIDDQAENINEVSTAMAEIHNDIL